VLVYYTWGLLLLYFFPGLGVWVTDTFGAGSIAELLFKPNWEVLVIIPIWAAAVLVMVIAMWIGWTMLTTPAPEPLEDFDFDEESIEPEKKEE